MSKIHTYMHERMSIVIMRVLIWMFRFYVCLVNIACYRIGAKLRKGESTCLEAKELQQKRREPNMRVN